MSLCPWVCHPRLLKFSPFGHVDLDFSLLSFHFIIIWIFHFSFLIFHCAQRLRLPALRSSLICMPCPTEQQPEKAENFFILTLSDWCFSKQNVFLPEITQKLRVFVKALISCNLNRFQKKCLRVKKHYSAVYESLMAELRMTKRRFVMR